MSSQNPCGKHDGQNSSIAKDVQKAAIQLDTLSSFTGFLPAVVPTIFLGPATDIVGRRMGFILPLLGTICRSLVFLFVYGLKVSVYFMYIGTVLEGLGGGFGAFMMTSFSASADITTPGAQRGLRICIIEAVNVVASSLAGFVSGQWRKRSYEEPVMFCAAFGVFWLIFALWVMPETLDKAGQNNRLAARSEPDARERFERGKVGGNYGSDLSSEGTDTQEVMSSRTRQGNELGRSGHTLTDDGFLSCSIQGHASESDRDFTESGISYNSTKISHNVVPSPPVSPNMSSARPVRFHDYGRYVPQTSGTPVPVERCDSFVCSNSARPLDSRLSTTHPAQLSSNQCGHVCGREHTESRARERDNTERDDRSCCGRGLAKVGRSFKVYFRVMPEIPARRLTLTLCFLAFLLTVSVNFSKPTLETVYRMTTLCWDAVLETQFDSGFLLQHWLFILIALHVFQKRRGVSDISMAMLGCVSGIAAPLVFAFAKNNVIVFISATCGTFARVLIPMLRSIASSVVDVDEQGALFASYACVELAGAAVFGLAFGQFYKATVDLWTGIVFLVLAAIMLLVFVILLFLAQLLRRYGHAQSYAGYGSTTDRE